MQRGSHGSDPRCAWLDRVRLRPHRGRHEEVSLIGSFREVVLEQFPMVLPPFSVHAVLSDGSGSGTLELILSRLETDEEVFSYRRPITFADQLTEVRVRLRISSCAIPAPGYYQLTLLVDGQ